MEIQKSKTCDLSEAREKASSVATGFRFVSDWLRG